MGVSGFIQKDIRTEKLGPFRKEGEEGVHAQTVKAKLGPKMIRNRMELTDCLHAAITRSLKDIQDTIRGIPV